MWLIDQIGNMFSNMQFAIARWIDRIDDSWLEMPHIKQYLIDIGNRLGSVSYYFYDLADDYDQLTNRAKDAILGSYYDLPSWLDSRQGIIMSWFSDLWNDIRDRMDDVETWIDDSTEWLSTELGSWFDNQENKVINWVETRAEDILDKMFED